jgi:hypothetical protein
MTTQTSTKISQRDALGVLQAILRTFPGYVCDGHESTSGEHMGETVQCNGMCAYHVARFPVEAKTYMQMDATPTLCGNDHEGLPEGCWSIFWEGNAPEDWVMSDALREQVREITGGRAFIEPINNCILGIYPV